MPAPFGGVLALSEVAGLNVVPRSCLNCGTWVGAILVALAGSKLGRPGGLPMNGNGEGSE